MNRFFPWTSGELPDDPYIMVHDSMIQKYGLDELKRIALEEFGRPVEIRAYPGLLPESPVSKPKQPESWRRKGKRRGTKL